MRINKKQWGWEYLIEKQPEKFKKQNETSYNDMEYVIQVDHKFVGRIDDIVKSLELSNYKVSSDKKKNNSDI